MIQYIITAFLLLLSANASHLNGFDYTKKLREQTGIDGRYQFEQTRPLLLDVYKDLSCTRRNTTHIETTGLLLGYRPCVYTENISNFIRAISHDYNLIMALSYSNARATAIKNVNSQDTMIAIYLPEHRTQALAILINYFKKLINTNDKDLFTKAYLWVLRACFENTYSEVEHAAQRAEFIEYTGQSPEMNSITQQAFTGFKQQHWPNHGAYRLKNDAHTMACDTVDQCNTPRKIQAHINELSSNHAIRTELDVSINTIIDKRIDPHQCRFEIEKKNVLNYLAKLGPSDENPNKLI